MNTNSLVQTLHRAAADFCKEHDCVCILPKVTDAMLHASLATMHWQRDRATADSIIVHEAAEQSDWKEIAARQNSQPAEAS